MNDDNSIYMFKLNIYCMIYIPRNPLYYHVHMFVYTVSPLYYWVVIVWNVQYNGGYAICYYPVNIQYAVHY